MLVPSDPTEAQALDTALAQVNREAYAVVQFDWNRNGLFDHQYSDLSEIASEVMSDRSHSSSLPDGVNAVSGFTSGLVEFTLGGSTYSGTSTRLLFDPSDGGSPLASFEIVGTPLRVFWRVRTPLGDIDTPGFHGHVSKFDFQRIAGTAKITGVDNYDMIGAEVSLPRWAAQTTSPRNEWYEDALGPALPISGKWALYDVLRQLGRNPIRDTQGVLSYQSCIGSTLPGYGHGGVFDQYQLMNRVSDNVYWKAGPEGWIAPDFLDLVNSDGETKSVLDKLMVGTSLNLHSAQDIVTVPVNGTSDLNQDLGFCCNWVRTYNGAQSVDTGFWSSTFYLEDFRLGEVPYVNTTVQEDPYFWPGQLKIQALLDGTIWIYIHENWDSSFRREWAWMTTTKVPLSTDLSNPTEVWVKINFRNNGITPEVRFNGVAQSLTVTNGNPALGFRYREFNDGDTAGTGTGSGNDQIAKVMAGRPRNGRSNAIQTVGVSNQSDTYPNVWAVEWFAATKGTSLPYVTRPTFPTLPNGKPRVKFKTRTGQRDLDGWLYYLPEVDGREGWSVLKDIVDGFRGTMYTDEWGTLHIGDASWAQVPAIPSTYSKITLDSLNEVNINPTEDNRRNNVILNGQFRGSVLGFVYEQQSAREKFAQGNTSYAVNMAMPLEAVMFNKRLPAVANTEPGGNDAIDINTGRVSAVNSYLPGNVATSPWAAGMATTPGLPRWFKALWAANSGDTMYIGSYKNQNEANWKASGRKLSDAIAIQGRAHDDVSIAKIGQRTLSLDTTEWLQSEIAGNQMAAAILTNLVQSSPLVDELEVPADPRRQVFDVVQIQAGSEQDSGAVFFAQILTKTTRWSGTEYTDTLGLRLLGNPGTGVWGSGIWGTSNWSS